jgi:hypothetical protein
MNTRSPGHEDQIKLIGARTRKRFHEERKKRREIQVINDLSEVKALEERAITSKSKRKQNAKRQIQELSRGASRHSQRARPKIRSTAYIDLDSDVLVDYWMPENYVDYYHAESHIARQEISNCVRVHGIPKGCGRNMAPDQVRKMFRGLEEEIEEVFTLPPHNFWIKELDIPPLAMTEGWDRSTKQEMWKKTAKRRVRQTGWIVQREPPTYRLFVKFRSKTSACLAVERSGELVTFPTESAKDSHDNVSEVKVAIFIAPLSKGMGSVLSSRLALVMRKGETFQLAQENFETQAFSNAEYVVWCMVANVLNLRHVLNCEEKIRQDIPLDGRLFLRNFEALFWEERTMISDKRKIQECHDAIIGLSALLQHKYWTHFLQNTGHVTFASSYQRIIARLFQWSHAVTEDLAYFCRRLHALTGKV